MDSFYSSSIAHVVCGLIALGILGYSVYLFKYRSREKTVKIVNIVNIVFPMITVVALIDTVWIQVIQTKKEEVEFYLSNTSYLNVDFNAEHTPLRTPKDNFDRQFHQVNFECKLHHAGEIPIRIKVVEFTIIAEDTVATKKADFLIEGLSVSSEDNNNAINTILQYPKPVSWFEVNNKTFFVIVKMQYHDVYSKIVKTLDRKVKIIFYGDISDPKIFKEPIWIKDDFPLE